MKKNVFLMVLLSLLFMCSCSTITNTVDDESVSPYEFYGDIHNKIAEDFFTLPSCKSGEYQFRTDRDFAVFMFESAKQAATNANIQFEEYNEQDIDYFIQNLNILLELQGDNHAILKFYENQIPEGGLKNSFSEFFESKMYESLQQEEFNIFYDNYISEHPNVSERDLRMITVFRSIGNASYSFWNTLNTKGEGDDGKEGDDGEKLKLQGRMKRVLEY